MGYTTDFEGSFKLDKPLADDHAAYLIRFNETRRMSRNSAIALTLPDPIRERVGLPSGEAGGYFIGGEGFLGQENDASVVDHNSPPLGQPSLWCKWTPAKDSAGLYTRIEWDEGEKFYNYIEWLEYLIEHFLVPWGYKLNGLVEWDGEDHSDIGTIMVKDNHVEIYEGEIGLSSDGSLYMSDVILNIKIALNGMDGDDVATAHNFICGKKIRYDEDSAWEYTGEDDNA